MSKWAIEPRDYTDRHVRFIKWKEDVEERLQKWLWEHSADAPAEQKLIPVSVAPSVGSSIVVSHGNKISVLPSNTYDGGWVVWMNGVIKTSFYGHSAHNDATQYATGLANGDISPDDPGSDMDPDDLIR